MKFEIADEVFQSYAFFSGILVVKMILMSALTAKQRLSKMVFANPDDAALVNGTVSFTDPDVERVRRAHLNDLENILPFFIIAFLYCFTSPEPYTANLVFKIFATSRIAHSFVYAVYYIPQPARGLAFVTGVIANCYMCYKVISHFA